MLPSHSNSKAFSNPPASNRPSFQSTGSQTELKLKQSGCICFPGSSRASQQLAKMISPRPRSAWQRPSQEAFCQSIWPLHYHLSRTECRTPQSHKKIFPNLLFNDPMDKRVFVVFLRLAEVGCKLTVTQFSLKMNRKRSFGCCFRCHESYENSVFWKFLPEKWEGGNHIVVC